MKKKQTIHGRLRQSREEAGYRSARAFALAHDMSEQTYRNHESGLRVPKNHTVRQYADILGVDYLWLLSGDIVYGGVKPASGGLGDSGYTGRAWAQLKKAQKDDSGTAARQAARFMTHFYESFEGLTPAARRRVRQLLKMEFGEDD